MIEKNGKNRTMSLPDVVFGVITDGFVSQNVEGSDSLEHLGGQLFEGNVQISFAIPSRDRLEGRTWRFGSGVQDESLQAVINGGKQQLFSIICSMSVRGIVKYIEESSRWHRH